MEFLHAGPDAGLSSTMRTEDLYHSLMQNQDLATYWLDPEGVFRYLSPAIERINGYQAHEIQGQSLESLIEPEDVPLTRAALAQIFAGQATLIEFRVVKKDGASRWIRASARPCYEKGELTGIAGFLMDISESREAKAALHKACELHRQIIASAAEGIAVLDGELRYIVWNPRMERLFDRQANAVLGKRPWDVLPMFGENGIPEKLQMALQGTTPPLPDLKIVSTAGNEERSVATEHTPLKDLKGNIVGVIVIVRDITEHRRAEDALRNSEERFRVALKTSQLTVFNQDSDLRYTWVHNPILVWADHECMGKTDAEMMGTMEAEEITSVKRQVLHTGIGIRRTFSLRHGNREHFVDATIEPLADPFGRTTGITGAAVDITDMHEKTEQLRQLTRKLSHEKRYLEREVAAACEFEDIIGESPTLRNVLAEVEMVAKTDSTVLILGETGTGKELLACAIHRMSERSGNNFIKLNCSAIPTGLLESELFGHEKGAFTGAITQKMGRLELADRGTLFLDEIGDIPLELQPKLLRVLEDREFERLGGTKTLRVSLRLVAATNRNLAESVEQKLFRRDLFYRLNVFPVRLPPLRERRDDIPVLVAHFVHKFSRQMNKHIERIPQETMAALTGWNWPGNIRELENFIERSVILSEGPWLDAPLTELETIRENHTDKLEEAGRAYIVRVLKECGGVISGPKGAAMRLGLKRTTLQSKMQRYGITRRDYNEPQAK